MTSTKLIIAALMMPALILTALVVAAAAGVHYLSTRHAATNVRVEPLGHQGSRSGMVNSIDRVTRRHPGADSRRWPA